MSKNKILSMFIVMMMLFIILPALNTETVSFSAREYREANENYLYLADIPYMSGSKTEWKTITYDKNTDGGSLALRLNGLTVEFDRGVFAHAKSTVIYNISEYDYDYFTTYYGVSAHQGSKGSVKFTISTSKDGIKWDIKLSDPTTYTGATNAGYAKIDIKDANYIMLYADSLGSNGNDHALYADAKLIKEGYSDNVTMTVEEYDNLIKEKYKGVMTEEIEKLVLERHLVNKIGTYQLKKISENAETKEAFDLLFNDLEMLRLYVAGGEPDGTYYNSFKVLSDLLKQNKDDLNASGSTPLGNPLKDVYKKMMISLSLTHSQTVRFWITSAAGEAVDVNPNISVATNRYKIYKDMISKNKLNNYFYQLEVEEMRTIMNSMISDDEIEWLRDYIVNSGKNWRSAYQFMSYVNVSPNLYRHDRFYGENRSQWNTKYKLDGYNLANVKYYPKTFMIMEVGGVCWQISNVGQTMLASYGVPSIAVGQPGHVAYLVYDLDSRGNSTWSIWNNVGGWQSTNLNNYNGTRGSYKVRLLNGWGNGSYASNNSGTYMMLSQAALDDYDNYVKAKELVLLANSYLDDSVEAEKIYRKALDTQSINLDAILGLINLYKNDDRNGDEMYALAQDVSKALTYYPLPMYDMLRLINSNVSSIAHKASIALLQTRTLETAKVATSNNTVQWDVCRLMANYLSGIVNNEVATFSFSTPEGAKITLSSMFSSSRPYWDYSLDNGETWHIIDDNNYAILTPEELKIINSRDNILIHMIGVSYTTDNYYRIDIKDSIGIPATLYNNDLENKLIGVPNALEWKYDSSSEWKKYSEEVPDLSGDKKVIVRVGAYDTYLPSEEKEYLFTKDSEDREHSYVSIDNLSIDSFSTENVRSNKNEFEYARNTIDGNLYTKWHTDRTSTTDKRFIVIKLAKPMYVSRVQYVPVPNYNYGVIKDVKISTSLDGKNYVEVYQGVELPKDNEVKDFDFENHTYAQYIKIECIHSYDYLYSKGADWFVSAAMFNIYADLTKSIPIAEIEYSRTSATAHSVTAKLVNASEEIKITNNGGSDTYTFDKNGEFIFEFEDKNGNKGSARASVNWILDYSFSFDGEDPYTIILGSEYKDKTWEYSIDGGTNWQTVNTLSHKLGDDEIANLSVTNGLKIRIEDEVINIPFESASTLPATLYANDWENRLIGATNEMEWRIEGSNEWTSYKVSEPNLVGNKVLEVRIKSYGTHLSDGEIKKFTFTDKGETDSKHVYVPIKHLEVHAFSSETNRPGNYEYATNAIDGNIYTFWFTSRTVVDNEKYIVLKLDSPRYISRVQYVPGKSSNTLDYGVMTDGIIYISVDGENWNEAARVSDLGTDDSIKEIELSETLYAKYIKIQATHTYQPNAYDNQFLSAAMFNIFEDKTVDHEESIMVSYNEGAEVGDYDEHELTNEDVTVRIYSLNSKIKILNNNGSDTYTFTDSGSFTFEYEDEYGNYGEYTVTVDWIDKEGPRATITYSVLEKTNKIVKAYLSFNEEYTVISSDLELETDEEGKKYLSFEDNGSATLKVCDKLGNESIVTASVSWIDKIAPTATVSYSTTEETYDSVTATITPSEEVTIMNNNGSNTYTFTSNDTFTFEMKDEAGNVGTVEAKVDWIKVKEEENPTEEDPSEDEPVEEPGDDTPEEKPSDEDNKTNSGSTNKKPSKVKPTTKPTSSNSNNTNNNNNTVEEPSIEEPIIETPEEKPEVKPEEKPIEEPVVSDKLEEHTNPFRWEYIICGGAVGICLIWLLLRLVIKKK